MKPYYIRVLLSVDQLANVVLSPIGNLFIDDGGALFGDPDDTISSVFRKNIALGKCKWCKRICRWIIHPFHKDHCLMEGEMDEGEYK